VRSIEGEIEVERLVWILRVDVFHRVIAKKLSGVTFLSEGLVVAVPVEHAVFHKPVNVQFALSAPSLN
jgi:hypothetical protein